MLPENQEQLSGILRNTNAATAELADAARSWSGRMAELQITLREASEALDQFEQVTESTDRILSEEGEAIAKDLRSTLKSASGAAKALEDTLNRRSRRCARSTIARCPRRTRRCATAATSRKAQPDGAAGGQGGHRIRCPRPSCPTTNLRAQA